MHSHIDTVHYSIFECHWFNGKLLNEKTNRRIVMKRCHKSHRLPIFKREKTRKNCVQTLFECGFKYIMLLWTHVMRTQMFFNNPVVECSGWCLAKRAQLVLWKGRRPMFCSLSHSLECLRNITNIQVHWTLHSAHTSRNKDPDSR